MLSFALNVAFLMVGAGMQTAQTAGLALATDLASEASRPRVVALMYVMLLLGMMILITNLIFSAESYGTAFYPTTHTMSSLIMSANAPKMLRSRGPSIAASICARSIDSKPNTYTICGETALGKRAFTMLYSRLRDSPPL